MRIQVGSQGWGWYADRYGNGIAGQTVTINGTIFTTEVSAVPVSPIITDDRGVIPGWIEEGTYDLTVNGTSYRVEAAGGDSVADIEAAVAGLVVGVATSGPATIHYWGSVTDTDGVAAAHPTWAGLVKSVVDPSGTVDQFTYDANLRLTSFREFGVTRTITYASSGDANGNATGVS